MKDEFKNLNNLKEVTPISQDFELEVLREQGKQLVDLIKKHEYLLQFKNNQIENFKKEIAELKKELQEEKEQNEFDLLLANSQLDALKNK